MDIPTGTIGQGSMHVRMEERPCKWCGVMTDFPIGAVAGTHFESVPAICDECELESIHEADRRAAKPDVEGLFKRSGAPDSPRLSLPIAFKMFGRNDQKGLFAHGEPGAFKTSSAVEFIRQWSKSGKSSMYMTEREYFEAQWHKDRPKLNRLRTIPLLVVDDIGTDYQSDYSAGHFFDLVDARYRRDVKTIWISNHDPEELAAKFVHFDARVIRRLGEMCEVVHMSGGGQ